MELPFLKKKSDAPTGPVVPAWHPNFRDYEKLPDVKVVRTAFFLNAAALLVFASLAIYFATHEWQVRTLRAQIAQTDQVIARDKKPSEQAVALYKHFQQEEAKVTEVDAFVKAKPVVSEILLQLAQTLPENLALDGFELRGNGVTLRLTVRGSPEVAAGYAIAYFEQLRADHDLAAFDPAKFQFSNQARNPTTGRLAIEFFLPFKPQYTDKKP